VVHKHKLEYYMIEKEEDKKIWPRSVCDMQRSTSRIDGDPDILISQRDPDSFISRRALQIHPGRPAHGGLPWENLLNLKRGHGRQILLDLQVGCVL
jgi:hypothetical protein